MIETGMYLYPWDIGESFNDFRREYGQTGCNAVAPALAYHHGSILSARSGRIRRLAESAVGFTPDFGKYGALKPAVHRETADRGVTESMREWCLSSGRRFSGWVVLLHNSTLGARHFGACAVNAMGDVLTHSLCPANPEVERYGTALIEDICARLAPDSLMLESATPRPARHGDHHEIANVGIGPAALWLLSLCFCPHCLEKAGKRPGLDPLRAKDACARLLKRLLNSETHFPGNDLAQLATLLLEYPELHAYQIERQARSAEFVAALSAAARRRGVEFRLIPSSFPFEIMQSFLEATGFGTMAGLADALVPLVYGPGETYTLVRNNIRLIDEKTPIGMALTLNPGRYPGKGEFLGAVAAAATENPHCAYFYNYSIASRERLGWMGEAAALLNR